MRKRKEKAEVVNSKGGKRRLGTGCLGLVLCGLFFSLFSPTAEERQATQTATALAALAVESTATIVEDIIPTQTYTATVSLTPTSIPSTATNTLTATQEPPTTAPTISIRAQTYYVLASANIRSCPQTTCEVVRRGNQGDALTVINQVAGEVISDSASWYEINSPISGFVHSSVVSLTRPSVNQVVPVSPIQSTPQIQSPYTCNGIDDLNCPDFPRDGRSAQAHLLMCGNEDQLDGDGDGFACEFTGW